MSSAPLSDDYLSSCPIEDGFRMRGQEMTRIEVFIDAAFAFALTMLVISFDRIPENLDEVVSAMKGIPAFVVAVTQLVWIWHEHSQWSERYGLRDTRTVILSTVLLMVMLVYIYPMRLMFEGLFWWMSGGYFPSTLEFTSFDDVRDMFLFLGGGLGAVCLVYFFMYRHAIACRDQLRLNAYEQYASGTYALVWIGCVGVCLICMGLAIVLADQWVPFAGFGYALLGIWVPWAHHNREKRRPAEAQAPA